MKRKGRIFTASVLSAIICLGCGAMATSASAAEIGNTAVQSQAYQPILREGVWQAEGLRGQTEYFEIRNSSSTIHILSAETKTGVPAQFDYDWENGIYTMHIGCVSNVETWELTSNNGRVATISASDGNAYSLFYLGPGSAKDVYSLRQLNEMAKNYFGYTFGSANDVCIDSTLRTDGSGLATVTVYARDTMRQVIVDTYTIDVRTGFGTNDEGQTIDFSYFA